MGVTGGALLLALLIIIGMFIKKHVERKKETGYSPWDEGGEVVYSSGNSKLGDMP